MITNVNFPNIIIRKTKKENTFQPPFSPNRDVEDTAERISKKSTLFSSSERGRELAAAHELKRKHLARAAEAGAIRDKIQQLEGEGKSLSAK